jgi:hypothetical protein
MAREKETVPVPTKKEVEDAARQTKEGHPSGGRVLEQQKEKKESEKK